jgi:hypothetical protein
MSDETRICDFAGHDFEDAGGGLEVCTECQAERWARPAARELLQARECLSIEAQEDEEDLDAERSAGHRRPGA